MQLSHFSPKLLAASAAVCICFIGAPAMATFTVDSDTSFSYTGTVTDPNGVAHSIVPYTSGGTTYTGRDLSLAAGNSWSIYNGYGGMQIETNWYASLDGLYDGIGNPNNTNSGFVKLQDENNLSVTSESGGWTNNYTTFVMSIIGGPETPTTGDNKLWAAPYTDGAGSTLEGEFQNYNFYLTATFASGAVTQESPGYFSTYASPLSVTGGFSGSFLNTGTLAPGLYSFNFTLQDTNWADANGIPDFSYVRPFFIASAMAVPEPPTLVLFGLFGAAILGLGSLTRRKRCS